MADQTRAGRTSAGQGRPELRLRWLGPGGRDEAGAIWAALEDGLGADCLACSWAWTETWLRSFGDAVEHRFAVGERDDRPCGVALVCAGASRRRGPFRLRTLHLGTAGEPAGSSVFVEYNRLLVGPEHRDEFAAALLSALHDDGAWHELRLDGFAPEDAEALLRAAPDFVARSEECPTVSLTSLGGGRVLGALRSGARRKVRRSTDALGELSTEWAMTPAHGLEILDELIELHQARWLAAGKPGAFADPRIVRFHTELIPRLLPTGRAILFRVRAGDQTVGCLYHFVERRRALFYQSGFSAYEDRRITPGFVAFALCMQECADKGLVEYDFLAGDSRYKRELSTESRELVWAELRRPALRWRLLDTLAGVRGRDRHG